ncbi:MAG TPA: aminotransferase class I/II-fold pyridoxal phosphate-dependent enzyme [Arenicellales bacterium]|nr:aminotransferase class I/II-fold pyridoxal phosphate-dependent enzyme [Arenicellales bacterium]
MKFSSLVDRIAGEGAAAWDLHAEAAAALDRGEDVILLSVGDPDLDTPEPVTAAAISALRGGDTHYTEAAGMAPLREAIARHFSAGAGPAVGPENVCVVPGAQNGLFFASMLLLQPGDEALTLEPCYVTYEATIGASGAKPVMVPTRAADGFRPDPDAIAAAVTPRTRALLITNPNNPTGVVMTADELDAIAGIARRHDLWVVSDEVYEALCFEGGHRRIAALPGMAERTVTVSSLSKSHAMTGWRAGWLVGPEPLMHHAINLALCVLYGMPGFVQQAMMVALEQSATSSRHIREVLRRRRDLVVAQLSGCPGLRVLAPQAGMFVMVDVRGTGLGSGEFARRLYDEQGVSVLDGSAFGPGAAGHVRLSFTDDEARLEEACRRIRGFCGSLGGEGELAHG